MSAFREAYIDENGPYGMPLLPPTVEELDAATKTIRRYTQPTTVENVVDYTRFYTQRSIDTMTEHVPGATAVVVAGALAAGGCASSPAGHNAANVIPLNISQNQAAAMIASPGQQVQTSQHEPKVLSILDKG